MAEEKYTVFQRLQKVLSNGSVQKNYLTNNYNIVSPSNSDIIATADTKDEYERKILQAKQQSLLGKQWVKANYEITNQSLAGLNDVRLMYRDADLMDNFPELGAALDIVAEEATYTNENGCMLNINSKSDRVKSVLEDLFVNRLSIHMMLPMICRSMCKYGNTFMLLNIDSKNGIMGWKQLPVYEMERWENGQNTPYATPVANLNSVDENSLQDTKFAWIGQTDYIPYRNWQVAHFRLLYDSIFLPYGCLVGDTRIETEYGYKEMSNIQIGDKVWTFNTETQKRELGTVTMFMPKGEKDVYKVSTFHNEIEGTNDHKLLTYNDNKLEYKEIKDLKVGDLLIIDNSFNKCNKDIKIDKSYPTEKEANLDKNFENDFKTEKIRKIDCVGKKQTYDFTVDNENSNFFANGIVTHNCSYLNKARRHFRMLSQMEDLMLIYRLDRSIERRVFKINVGAIDEKDVYSYVNEIANNFKRKPIVDPMTGQIDLRKSFMNVTEDYFIPIRDDNASSPIETLQGAQNLTAMDDIKFVQNKLLTALGVPKSFLNFDETSGDGKNLSLLDVRFSRKINRIQQSLLMELNKIAVIHLYLNGFQDDLNNFTLTMNNPSSQAEMLELENLAKKITTAKDAVSDPGGGIPLASMMWAWKHIFKWSDKEIKQNLEELRLETALAAELQKTMQIIKKTGMFDSVDNLYGEPGAEYTDDGMGQDQDEMGGGPSGGGGGMPMGGDLDFGDEGEGGEEEIGAEGEMGMDMAAEENGAVPDTGLENEGGGEQTPNLMEALFRRMDKKVTNEKNKINESLMKRSKHYADILQERLINHKVDEPKKVQKVDIYDKAFFLNEEMNDIKEQLGKIDSGSDTLKD